MNPLILVGAGAALLWFLSSRSTPKDTRYNNYKQIAAMKVREMHPGAQAQVIGGNALSDGGWLFTVKATRKSPYLDTIVRVQAGSKGGLKVV